MSSGLEAFRLFISSRLTAAARDIYTEFTLTDSLYQQGALTLLEDRKEGRHTPSTGFDLELGRALQLCNEANDRGEPGPPQTDEEQEEPGPPQTDEEQEEPGPPQTDEEQEEPGPPQTDEEQALLAVKQEADIVVMPVSDEKPERGESLDSHHFVRTFISGRLAAAAEEIFAMLQETILSRPGPAREEVHTPCREPGFTVEPQIKLHRIEEAEPRVWEEQRVWEDQGMKSSSHQEEPEAPHIKEEPEEVYTSQEREQLVLKEEVDTFLISYGEQSEPELDGEPLNPQDSVVAESQHQKKSQHVESRSSRKANLKSNRRRHSKNVDNSSFTAQSSPSVHMTVEKPHSCIICGRSFSQPWYLSFHMRSHADEKPHSCLLCGKNFAWKSNLTVHMKTHTGDKPHSCITCGKSFAWKSNLSVHMRTHTGEKPYPCLTCGKSFSQPFSLSVHMKTHTGEKPHNCVTCGKSFIHQSRLLFHMRTHTGEKPYSCVTCCKSFSTNGNFQRHLRTHTGEKPYSCLTCGKRFSKQSSVMHHMKIHTGEKSSTYEKR